MEDEPEQTPPPATEGEPAEEVVQRPFGVPNVLTYRTKGGKPPGDEG
jgi:hypothetical protein